MATCVTGRCRLPARPIPWFTCSQAGISSLESRSLVGLGTALLNSRTLIFNCYNFLVLISAIKIEYSHSYFFNFKRIF